MQRTKVHLTFKGLKKTEKESRTHSPSVIIDPVFKLTSDSLDIVKEQISTWLKANYSDIGSVHVTIKKQTSETIDSFTFVSDRQLSEYCTNDEGDLILEVNGIILDKKGDRMRLIFPYKPCRETRWAIKDQGFRWCRTTINWQRAYSTDEALLRVLGHIMKEAKSE